MSLFDNHFDSVKQDDIVLQHYNFRESPDYKGLMILEEKKPEDTTYFDWSWYYRKVFIPLDIVWKDYVHEASDDIVRMWGIQNRPTKSDFIDFAKTFSHPAVKKLIFQQQTYINRAILRPIFDAFNEHWCFKMLQARQKIYNEIC